MDMNRMVSKGLSFLVVLALIASVIVPALTVSAQAGTVAYVNTGNLNIRTGPSIAYGIIAKAPFNTELLLLGRTNTPGNTWVQVRTGAITGWVNYLYLRSFARLDSLPVTWNQTVPPTNPNPPQPGGPITHLVRAGETLQIIARRYGTTWQAIAAANNLINPNFIFTGQRLIIPLGGVVTPPYQPPSQQPGGQVIHVVQPGETLRSIADRYGTTWPTIAAANSLPNPNYIFSGQRLIIPAGPPRQPRVYTVQPGDGLYQIALRFGTSVAAISAANGLLNPNAIFVGQQLIIP